MNQLNTLDLLSKYHPKDNREQVFKTQFEDLVRTFPNFYDRNLLPGHVTGSAWIINETKDKVLLVHHRKLDRWLQPGGHADAKDDGIYQTAWRETQEETGLQKISVLQKEIFDLDIHLFPARAEMPQHAHYDVRFCLIASEDTLLTLSPESKELRWFSIEEVTALTEEESLLRMVRKMAIL